MTDPDQPVPTVLTERTGHVLLITINRPQARNALDRDVATRLADAFDAAEADPEIRCVVLTGAGDQAFSAGADLKALARGERPIVPGREHYGLAGFVRHPMSTPVIAAVNGAALGGGTELALAADLVVAAEHATFGVPEVKRGILAAAGGVFRLPEQLPRKVAMRLVLTGEPMGADEALRWGLVNEVVPAADVLPTAMRLAEVVAANAPLAVQASKRLALGIVDGDRPAESATWDRSAEEMSRLFASADAAEGMKAFAEKRPPRWTAG
ncbi:crotonase/enoyl-CoA hydratase family protein [Blastococcus goldschmidtiae]|uniref:Crotonase/enoyl-CoA hydratase family protein n=1 Tax=Blastococcus goldschmidtiae TaxID=3075546 RepID=A0ABU2K886_9ACTN|nr:crotonase/enoyl-CoA hydratase family protein [Blastococcus sp. DSM 46792]MDT0276391.1 crotonase/enoyl-CoA hydratase family protein [Blastococcus sp. DSM 46792]